MFSSAGLEEFDDDDLDGTTLSPSDSDVYAMMDRGVFDQQDPDDDSNEEEDLGFVVKSTWL